MTTSLELDDVLAAGTTKAVPALALSIKHHRPVVVYDLHRASDTVVAGPQRQPTRACGHR
ncbi:hypothetical protein LN650_17985 [Klebsiella pneumoniae subsp. pneumoniae]|nr:hypothetical protein [Klebsiella pneumoniae subsp. pneumoniae]